MWDTYDKYVQIKKNKRICFRIYGKVQVDAKEGHSIYFVVYHESLPSSKTIDSNFYFLQLRKLQQTIEKNRQELVDRKGVVVIHYDNAEPHTSLPSRQTLRELGWKTLMYLPCGLKPGSSNYHLFHSLLNSLYGRNLISI